MWSPKEAIFFAMSHINKYYVMWKKENILQMAIMILVNEQNKGEK